MGTTYTFRCPAHGDFQVQQPMATTTPSHCCPVSRCRRVALKVLGGALQFTYGRQNFHDGPDGTGETVREVGARWRGEYKAQHGRDIEPVGARWV